MINSGDVNMKTSCIKKKYRSTGNNAKKPHRRKKWKQRTALSLAPLTVSRMKKATNSGVSNTQGTALP